MISINILSSHTTVHTQENRVLTTNLGSTVEIQGVDLDGPPPPQATIFTNSNPD